MCESTVYTTDNEKIMEDVISIKIDGDIIDMADVLNSKRQVRGRIMEIDLDKHVIYVEIS